MADAAHSTPAPGAGQLPRNFADHMTHLSNVMGALHLAIDGVVGCEGEPNEAAMGGLGWLAGYARGVVEGLHALAHEERPRWIILAEAQGLLRDLEAQS